MTNEKTKTPKQNIVVNSSRGYGYNYASLGDIASQGFAIPKMKTGTENEKEYIYYYDEELKDWIRGAEIVVPDSPKNAQGKEKMNKAQLYGSALTYARRFTILMCDKLATDDDKGIDEEKEEIFDEVTPALIDDYCKDFEKLFSAEKKAQILNGYGVTNPHEMDFNVLKAYVDRKKNEK